MRRSGSGANAGWVSCGSLLLALGEGFPDFSSVGNDDVTDYGAGRDPSDL